MSSNQVQFALSVVLLGACAPAPPSPDAATDAGVDGFALPSDAAADTAMDAATESGVDGSTPPDLALRDDLSIPLCSPTCADGTACAVAADCAGRVCDHGLCATDLCLDGKKDGKETDIDCGGGVCLKCGGKKACSGGGDCLSGQCKAGKCAGSLALSFAPLNITDPKGCDEDDGSITVVDFNGDLFPDLFTGWGGCGIPGSGDTGGATFWLSDGQGGFGASSELFVWNENSHTFGARCSVGPVGDFNGDGRLDATVYCIYDRDLTTSFDLCLGGGVEGGFASCKINPVQGSLPYADAAGDWNGDGKLDLDANGQVFLGDGKGGFAGMYQDSNLSCPLVFTGDLNGDQRLDSVIVSSCIRDHDRGIAIRLGKGDGTFNEGPDLALPDPTGVLALADVNADGRLDLVLFDANGVSTRLGLGNGAFGPAIASPKVMPDPGWTSLQGAAADFDQDGALDVACLSHTGLTVLMGGGDGTFKPVTIPLNGLNALGIVAADFNRDGKPDIAVEQYEGNGPRLFFNTSH